MPLHDVRQVVVESRLPSKSSSTFQVPAHLELVKTVGCGAYGLVASFRDTRTNKMLAIKKISNAFNNPVDGKKTLRELKLLRQIKHRNIIRLFDIFPPTSPAFQDVYIVTDLMEVDLNSVIYSRQGLEEKHQTHFMHQILCGLVYLHSINVVHRDLKPSNIVVNRDCSLKICDLGSAQCPSSLGENNGGQTRWYRAPETILVSSICSTAEDVWAAGCILAEFVARKPLFRASFDLQQIRTILAILGRPSEEDLAWLPSESGARALLAKGPEYGRSWKDVLPSASNAAIEVIDAMVRFSPSGRRSAREILDMQYFDDVRENHDKDEDCSGTPIDWSFDDFSPNRELIQSYVYCECARFHPEILVRDREYLQRRLSSGDEDTNPESTRIIEAMLSECKLTPDDDMKTELRLNSKERASLTTLANVSNTLTKYGVPRFMMTFEYLIGISWGRPFFQLLNLTGFDSAAFATSLFRRLSVLPRRT